MRPGLTPVGCLLLALAVGCSAAHARNKELTATFGLRTGGAVNTTDVVDGKSDFDAGPAYGLAFGWALSAETGMEVFWSRQDTEIRSPALFPGTGGLDLSIDYLHFGGVYSPHPERGIRPFVGASAGLTHYSPSGGGFDSQIEFSAALSGGATFRADKRVGIRVLGRGYATFSTASFSGACGPTACTLKISGSGAIQFEGLVGLVLPF